MKDRASTKNPEPAKSDIDSASGDQNFIDSAIRLLSNSVTAAATNWSLECQRRCCWTAGLLAIVCLNVNAAEPPEVPTIRKECNAIDKEATHWRTTGTDESCEGESCSDTELYVDAGGTIRKIEVQIEGGGPVNSKDHFRTESAYYFDNQGRILFRFVMSRTFLEAVTPHEQRSEEQHSEDRYYFRNGFLVAWKRNDQWIGSNDPRWRETANELALDISDVVKQARESLRGTQEERKQRSNATEGSILR
jgi:hypothetical protein